MNTMLGTTRSQTYLAALLYAAGTQEHKMFLEGFSTTQKAAATILLAQAKNEFSVEIQDPFRTERFELDTESDQYVSKADWRWVHLIALSYQDHSFLELTFPKKLIDLPYKAHRINARWLLSYTRDELVNVLEK